MEDNLMESEFVNVSQFTYLLHPYNTSLVTCCNAEGKANIIAIAWLVPISISPPLLGMCVRPTRYSYKLIQATGEFVVNIASLEIARQALFCGRKSGSGVDKFAATGLTPLPARHVHPPIIQECLAYVECRLQREVEIGDHNLLVGEVLAAYARPGTLGNDDLYDLNRVHPLLHLGRNRFTSPQAQTVEPSLIS
jgi:flavin reductase (DIM6/NTAB) family NADH-FMN oxidoreductase RutF